MSRWYPSKALLRLLCLLALNGWLLAGCAPQDRTPESGEASPEDIRMDDSLLLLNVLTLPGQPVALGFHESNTGYLATYDGRIYEVMPFRDADPVISIRLAAEGLGVLQGLEVAGDVVYVSSLGQICEDPAGMYCGSWDEEYEDPIQAELGVLRSSEARILALDILEDGSLSGPRTVLAGLPVVTIGHSPHGMVLGMDGRLYLSIGHLDKSFEVFEEDPEKIRSDTADAGLLGTVLSFEPDGSDPRVFASGFRNVYDLAFDLAGRLYAADNDGAAVHGPMFDEINLVLEGSFYGYPEYGTFTPQIDHVRTPLWMITDGVGTAGIESADQIGHRSGLFVGQTGRMLFVRFEIENDRVFVYESARTMIEAPGIFTVIDADRDGHLYVGLFLQEGENRLLVVEVAR